MSKGTPIIALRTMDPDLLAQVDTLVKREKWADRSALVRELLRGYVATQSNQPPNGGTMPNFEADDELTGAEDLEALGTQSTRRAGPAPVSAEDHAVGQRALQDEYSTKYAEIAKAVPGSAILHKWGTKKQAALALADEYRAKGLESIGGRPAEREASPLDQVALAQAYQVEAAALWKGQARRGRSLAALQSLKDKYRAAGLLNPDAVDISEMTLRTIGGAK